MVETNGLQDLGLRVGLAGHRGFAGAIRERLALEVLSDIPTAYLTLEEIASGIAVHFQGVRVTVPDLQVALGALEDRKWVGVEPPGRTGDARYYLTLEGQENCDRARREGRDLERRVKEKLYSSSPALEEAEAEARWASLLAALDSLFKSEALRVAEALLNNRRIQDLSPAGVRSEDPTTAKDLASFLNEPDLERAIYLRRLLHGALAVHLFRHHPEADERILRHLRGRTLFLDTTVIYALAAEDGELGALGDNLVRLARGLDCRLEITSETMAEFQESVAHYKHLLVSRGITDGNMARALLGHRLGDVDDFRRGFYRALIKEPNTEVEAFALQYEMIEERLPAWGISRPRPIPSVSVIGPDGRPAGPAQVSEFEQSLQDFLERHPKRNLPKDETIKQALIHHDALHIAWVAETRARRDTVTVPVRPSQVNYWFLTRDRIVADWDKRYVDRHGPGKVGRCMGLEEWIQSVAVFAPDGQESDALSSIALRLLALHAPAFAPDQEINIEDLQRIGRVAQAFHVTPEDAGRLAADNTLLEQLEKAESTDMRIAAVKDGVLRVRDEQIDTLSARVELYRTEASQVPRLNKALKKSEQARDRALTSSGSSRAEIDRIARRQKWALFAGFLLVLIFGLSLAYAPELWNEAGIVRQGIMIVAGTSLIAAIPMVIMGYSKMVWLGIVALGVVISLVFNLADLWTIGAPGESENSAPSEVEQEL